MAHITTTDLEGIAKCISRSLPAYSIVNTYSVDGYVITVDYTYFSWVVTGTTFEDGRAETWLEEDHNVKVISIADEDGNSLPELTETLEKMILNNLC